MIKREIHMRTPVSVILTQSALCQRLACAGHKFSIGLFALFSWVGADGLGGPRSNRDFTLGGLFMPGRPEDWAPLSA